MVTATICFDADFDIFVVALFNIAIAILISYFLDIYPGSIVIET
jgi:hypothetical protein